MMVEVSWQYRGSTVEALVSMVEVNGPNGPPYVCHVAVPDSINMLSTVICIER